MSRKVQLGIRENLGQFSLLVLVNAFVGGMLGLERSILPRIAEAEFHMAAKSAILSFIVVFGLVKAFTNYFSGKLSNRLGRKNLLVAGWLFALPVPFILMQAENWNWILAANILLGIHQGLSWSSTVLMKIDLVGEEKRGFAMGLNEFAGYIAVAAIAFLTGWIASSYGLRPYPFYTGIVMAFLGLLISLFLVKDTMQHVLKETESNTVPRLRSIFWDTSLLHPNLGSVTQSGLINNLNDGMVWGLLPILLAQKNFGIADIGSICAIYPAVWGLGQLVTGKMSDFFCKKSLMVWGMMLQGIAILLLVFAQGFFQFACLAALLGWGTAMVYPTFLATIAENTHPADRPESLGIFRLWRDLGYALGAILTGLLADAFGLLTPILAIGGLTILSALLLEYRMSCRINNIKIGEWILKKSGLLKTRDSSDIEQISNPEI